MRLPLLFLLALWALPSSAQTLLPCTTGCPARYYFEVQPCSAGVCARSWAPLPGEFPAKGMNLFSYEGVEVQICAAHGERLLGTGTLRWWTWAPWMPNDVTSTPLFDMAVADADRGEECSYTTLGDGGVVSGVGAGDGGTNLLYRCRCLRWTDFTVGGLSGRRVMLQAVGVGTTGGTQLEVRLVGLEVIR